MSSKEYRDARYRCEPCSTARPNVVEHRAGHREQGRAQGFVQVPGLGGGRGPCADGLPGDPEPDAGRPQDVVEAALLQTGGAELDQAGREVVGHQGERLVLGAAQPPDPDDVGIGWEPQCDRDWFGRRHDPETANGRGRMLAGPVEVVVQAGQLDRAADLRLHHLRPDSALADQHALVDETLDGLPHRRPGQGKLPGEDNLVREPGTGRQRARDDRLLDLLGDLEVEGDRTSAVDRHGEFGHPLSLTSECLDKLLTQCRPPGKLAA